MKQKYDTIIKQIGQSLPLKATGSWPDRAHYLDEDTAYAITAAISANRPLLIRGEPGCGKSQAARAAAYLMGRAFIYTVVQPNSDYEDLLWSFDHTSRLADAQMKHTERVARPDNYIAPGAFWYALSWVDAQSKACKIGYQPPDDIDVSQVKKQGVVLLVDEIDKADISLSNGLLEVLGNGEFSVPMLGKTVRAVNKPPLVVLTSNDTRALPDALERRCVVLKIDHGEGDQLTAHLIDIGKTHHPDMHEDILEEAARQIIQDRERSTGHQKTGQAEYLDLLEALQNISKAKPEQLRWLAHLSGFFMKSGHG